MDADRNPFEYVRPLRPEDVTGRDALVDRLVGAVRARHIVAVAGPRRFGKTSILGRVAQIAEQVDAVDVVTVDCFGLASLGEFAVRLETAMSGLRGPARRLASRLLAPSELGLSITPGVGFKVRFGQRDAPDASAVLHALLDTLVAVSEQRGGLLLVLDEFQDVARVEHLDAVLRTHLQHAREVAVLFAGSRPSLMRALFEDRTRPFYAQAEIIEVERFDVDTAAGIVEDGFAATGDDAGPGGEIVAHATEGHPQRLMLVAHLMWELVDPGGAADAEVAGAALEAAHARTEAEHRATVDGLDRTHRDTLRAVAGYGSPYARAAERTLGLARSSVQGAVGALTADALLERTSDGAWRVVDPLLAHWLRATLPPPGGVRTSRR
ncbi:ATP-binding protein [Actinomarinicola tropica]|uniref:AAA family ATPase n=1 Tax=Actinomarinicola tropica TaxID=2789776 RepID=UPI0018980FDE|nr:AAA family ATPase [Actinomarinicola tropica]